MDRIINLFILVVMTASSVLCDRTSQKIYYNIEDKAYSMCFRRFNGTNQIGCSSERKGNVGVLHYIEKKTDVDWLVAKGTNAPYIALLPPDMFNRHIVGQLKASKKINGFLIIHTKNITDDFIHDVQNVFSPDLKCPNEHHSLYSDNDVYGHCKNNTWDPEASELLLDDSTNLPIALLMNDSNVEFLINRCYGYFNKPGDDLEARQYPLCSVQLKIAMDGAKDTPTCIRRSNYQTNLSPQSYCDPLGGYNVYSFLHPISSNETVENKSVILVAARMDALSMFDKHYPGVESTLTGLTTLLAVADAIGRVKDKIPSETSRPILFALFNGESFDYIGSSRMVYDMNRGWFPTYREPDSVTPHPISLDHVGTFIEIGQVGLPQDGKMWIHSDPLSTAEVKSKVAEITSALKQSTSDIDLLSAPETQALPPASLQTFLKKAPIPGIVLADYNQHFSNRFYNSRLDKAELINMTYDDMPAGMDEYDYITPAASHLTKVATAVARAVYKLATNNNDQETVEADNVTVNHILYCYAKRPGCELFNATLESANSKNLHNDTKPFALYVGVVQGTTPSLDFRSHCAVNLLGYFLGDHVDLNKTMCSNSEQNDPLYKFTYVNGPINQTSPDQARLGLCIKATSNVSLAKSPAFDIKDYDWNSHEYSAWTESRWGSDAFLIRSFLVPSRNQEVTVLLVGISLFLFSLVFAYFMNKKAPELFRSTGMRTPLLQEE